MVVAMLLLLLRGRDGVEELVHNSHVSPVGRQHQSRVPIVVRLLQELLSAFAGSYVVRLWDPVGEPGLASGEAEGSKCLDGHGHGVAR